MHIRYVVVLFKTHFFSFQPVDFHIEDDASELKNIYFLE